jgi:2-dehydro-3-deoxygalactonokinase
LIAIDWGTSNFRAFRLDEAGEIIERRFFPGGILSVQDGRFEEMLLAQVGDWLKSGKLVSRSAGWSAVGRVGGRPNMSPVR